MIGNSDCLVKVDRGCSFLNRTPDCWVNVDRGCISLNIISEIG